MASKQQADAALPMFKSAMLKAHGTNFQGAGVIGKREDCRIQLVLKINPAENTVPKQYNTSTGGKVPVELRVLNDRKQVGGKPTERKSEMATAL